MITKIDVTREDIDNGTKRACGLCPVALAAKRVVAPFMRVAAYSTALELVTTERPFRPDTLHRLPATATSFIIDFDRGSPVEPFSFELDIPEEFLLKETA